MTFSAMAAEQADDRVTAAARALSGADAIEVTPAAGGGNNRVFRVLAGGETLALKSYPDDGDPRDRLGVEFSSLQYLKRHGIETVPAAVASDPKKGFALYEWIDGSPIDTPGDADIDAVLGFIEALIGLAATEEAKVLPLASEACLSAAELCRQVEDRLKRLIAAAEGHPGLTEFLMQDLSPALETLHAGAGKSYDENGADFNKEIEASARTLNPSDFGFHNALRKPDGTVVFLDFEYFGWDDPVKLVSDFLLHPGHALSPQAGEKFFQGAGRLFANDLAFPWRLLALYPLYGLRWCLIMLAEFLPERMARRQMAGQHADPEKARQDQLEKSRALLDKITSIKGALPYGD